MGSFDARIARLASAVGDGDLVMGGVVMQPYAAAEHNRPQYKHPRGGVAKFIEIPFIRMRDEMIERLAALAITPGGSQLRQAARENADAFDTMTQRFAPLEFNILRNSTLCYVTDNGSLVYSSGPDAEYEWEKE